MENTRQKHSMVLPSYSTTMQLSPKNAFYSTLSSRQWNDRNNKTTYIIKYLDLDALYPFVSITMTNYVY